VRSVKVQGEQSQAGTEIHDFNVSVDVVMTT
jgi:hypothetical protein